MLEEICSGERCEGCDTFEDIDECPIKTMVEQIQSEIERTETLNGHFNISDKRNYEIVEDIREKRCSVPRVSDMIEYIDDNYEGNEKMYLLYCLGHMDGKEEGNTVEGMGIGIPIPR